MTELNEFEGLDRLEKRFDSAKSAEQIDGESIWEYRSELSGILYDGRQNEYRLADESDNPDLLRVLAKLGIVEIRQRVAQNRNTPQDVLELLSNDPEELVVLNVAHNPKTSAETLAKLVKHSSSKVRIGLASNLSASDVHEQLLKDPDVGVRFYLAFNSKDPDILRAVAEDETIPRHVFCSIAANEHTPLDILESLADVADDDCCDSGKMVRHHVAKNPTYLAAHPA